MARSTWCPRLWDEVYIDQKGRVFSCCHNKPAVLGSILELPLDQIVNGAAIRGHRRRALQGRLSCYRHCTLLSPAERAAEPPGGIGDEIAYADLKRLKVLFGEACNIDCIMCWQDSSSREVIDLEALTARVDLTPFESVEIQGGEPLFIPEAKTYFDHVAAAGIPISFLTNGTIMTEEWAAKIARHSEFVYISLNAATPATHELINRGSEWTRVMRSLERLHSARAAAGSGIEIRAHMTIVRQNIHEVPAFIAGFGELGFDAADFGFDLRLRPWLALHPRLRSRLRAEIATALAKLDDRAAVDTSRLEILRLV